jgi:hypothetical protein
LSEPAETLSEFGQRRLDEIERARNRDDPGFVSSVNLGAMRRHRRLVAAAVLGLLGGAVLAQRLQLVGVAISVLGFVLMVAGAGLFRSGRPGFGGGGNWSPGFAPERLQRAVARRFAAA